MRPKPRFPMTDRVAAVILRCRFGPAAGKGQRRRWLRNRCSSIFRVASVGLVYATGDVRGDDG